MKIISPKNKILAGVSTVLKAVPAKSTMQVLECVMIEASDENIRLSATDTEMAIETFIEGTVEEPGHVAIDAKLLSEIIRKLPDSDIIIETDENYKALITCEKAVFNIPGRSGDDFPSLPEVEKNDVYIISQFSLKEIIRQTIFAIADSNVNPVFSGELFEFSDSTLRVVALDGQRIAVRKIELKESHESLSAIVPGKALSEVGKILSGDIDSDVKMYITPLHMMFEFDSTTVVTRLIEGEYFQIDRMLSSDYSAKTVINKKDMQDCVERVSLLVRESDRSPAVMDVEGDSLKLSINSPMGFMNEEIDIVHEGKDLEIGFNPRFMLDALRVIDDEEISMYLINQRSPFSIKDDEGTYDYIILPISLNRGI